MKAVFALALVLGFLTVGCGEDAGLNETTPVMLTYQPFQCVDDPWDRWYSSGGSQFSSEPTPEELITEFYIAQGINLTEVERYDPGQVVCNACEVCPTSYVFRAVVMQSDAEKLRQMGWNSTVS